MVREVAKGPQRAAHSAKSRLQTTLPFCRLPPEGYSCDRRRTMGLGKNRPVFSDLRECPGWFLIAANAKNSRLLCENFVRIIPGAQKGCSLLPGTHSPLTAFPDRRQLSILDEVCQLSWSLLWAQEPTTRVRSLVIGGRPFRVIIWRAAAISERFPMC